MAASSQLSVVSARGAMRHPTIEDASRKPVLTADN
jgi:hypothetical protein